MIYENQDEVGAALKKVIPSVVKREDLWITSKVWNTSHRPDQVEKELDETLKQLGTDYLDLYRALTVFNIMSMLLILLLQLSTGLLPSHLLESLVPTSSPQIPRRKVGLTLTSRLLFSTPGRR